MCRPESPPFRRCASGSFQPIPPLSCHPFPVGTLCHCLHRFQSPCRRSRRRSPPSGMLGRRSRCERPSAPVPVAPDEQGTLPVPELKCAFYCYVTAPISNRHRRTWILQPKTSQLTTLQISQSPDLVDRGPASIPGNAGLRGSWSPANHRPCLAAHHTNHANLKWTSILSHPRHERNHHLRNQGQRKTHTPPRPNFYHLGPTHCMRSTVILPPPAVSQTDTSKQLAT